jgi:hypothetical protein
MWIASVHITPLLLNHATSSTFQQNSIQQNQQPTRSATWKPKYVEIEQGEAECEEGKEVNAKAEKKEGEEGGGEACDEEYMGLVELIEEGNCYLFDNLLAEEEDQGKAIGNKDAARRSR